MTPKSLKSLNLFTSVVFTLAGVVCLSLAVYLTVVPKPAKQTQVVRALPDRAGCERALRELGFSVSTGKGNRVLAHTPDLVTPPKEWVDKASLGIAACHLPMQSFCIGEGCSPPGISFELVVPAVPPLPRS